MWIDRELYSASTDHVSVPLQWLCKFILNNFHTALISVECRHETRFCFLFQIQKSILSTHDIWFHRKQNSVSTGDFFVSLQWLCKLILINFRLPSLVYSVDIRVLSVFFSKLKNRFSLYITYGLIGNQILHQMVMLSSRCNRFVYF